MNHEEAGLLIGGDPGSVPPELAEHLASCPECSQFQREMLVLDANIRRALEQPPGAVGLVNESFSAPVASGAPVEISDTNVAVGASATPTGAGVAGPPPAAAPITPPPSAKVDLAGVASAAAPSAKVIPMADRRAARHKPTTSWSGWALAASVLFAAVATLAIWALHPTNTLAHDVVTHVQGEPKSWASSQQVSADALNELLRKAGVALDANSDKVMYARTCWFRGHAVPHLVVNTSRGPVTVLVLRHENVKTRESFHEAGMTGVITPAPRGSIAVLAQGSENIDEVAERVQESVRWLPGSQ